MNHPRFEIILDPDASKEYSKLDNSVIELVDKSIDELEHRADEVGKPLSNHNDTKLAGCKEIKLRDAGIRIVFRVTNERVDVLRIVYILTIEERSRDSVFKLAHKRFKYFKSLSKTDLREHLKRQLNWKNRNKK